MIELLVLALVIYALLVRRHYAALRAPRVDATETRRAGRSRGYVLRSMRPGLGRARALLASLAPARLCVRLAQAWHRAEDAALRAATMRVPGVAAASMVHTDLKYFDVRAYGATESADALAGLVAADAAAAAAGGGVVFVPEGTFTLSAVFTLSSGNMLIGAGRGLSFLKIPNGADAGAIYSVVQTATSGDCYIAHLTIDGNRQNNAGWAIVGSANYGLAVRCQEATIFDVETKNVTANGMGVPTLAENVAFVSCFSHDNGKKGFHSGNVGRIRIVGGAYYDNSTDSGIGMHSGIYSTIVSGVHCYGNGTYGLELGDADGAANTDSRFATISGCIFESNTQNGLYLYADDSVNTSLRVGVTVSGCVIRNNTLRGVEIVNARYVALNGLILADNGEHGLLVTSCDDITVGGCVLFGNHTSAGASELAEIFVRGVAHSFGAKQTSLRITISGCTLAKTTTSGSTKGVSLGSTVSNCVVRSNTINGFGTSAVRDYGSAANGHLIDGNLADLTPDKGGGTYRFGGPIEADTINERTAAAGVTIDGVLLKDNKIAAAGLPDAALAARGAVLKAAALTAADPGALTDNTAGTADTTLQALNPLADNPVTADALRDDIETNLMPRIKNNFADLAAQCNALRARLEDLIAQQQTAGQQT